MVGAVVAKKGIIIGRGYHHRAGEPHAEVLALRNASSQGHSLKGASLYVTLEPCCTHGRTPPCTDAIITAGIRTVIVAATDPNPRHRGHGFTVLRNAGIKVKHGLLAGEAGELNEVFNHWIVTGTPFVTVKAAMTLDGKIATPTGESKWITGDESRRWAMKLRQGADAIVAGINTVLLDDPSLTCRLPPTRSRNTSATAKHLRRIILDSDARTPLKAKVVADDHAGLTTIVVSSDASERRVKALEKKVQVWRIPERMGALDLPFLLCRLASENVTGVLVEGGGETNAAFLRDRLVQRVAFFYAPMVLGGTDSRKGVAGEGAAGWEDIVTLDQMRWKRFGQDLFMTARVAGVREPKQ